VIPASPSSLPQLTRKPARQRRRHEPALMRCLGNAGGQFRFDPLHRPAADARRPALDRGHRHGGADHDGGLVAATLPTFGYLPN
jgi:hypothetical protein